MALSAAFTVEGNSNPAEHEVSYGDTVDLALASLDGVNTIDWSIVGVSKAGTTKPTITAAGTPSGATASFAMPSDPGDGLGRSFRVKVKVTDANGNSEISYAIVGAANEGGVLPIPAGEEENERHATQGWTDVVNAALRGTTGLASASTLTALRAASTDTTVRVLKGRTATNDGGEGIFVWDPSDLSTEVAADTQAGIYVAPNSDLTGASGAWVRIWAGAIQAEWFGASPDATAAENVTAIQAALDWAGSNGGARVMLGLGVYSVNAALTLPNDTYLVGQGVAATTIRLADNSDDQIVKNADQTNGNDDCGVQDLTFDGNKANQTFDSTIYMVHFVKCNRPYIRNVEATGSAGEGVRVSSGGVKEKRDALIDNLRVHDNNHDGIRVMFGARGSSYTNVWAYDNGNDGVVFDHSEGEAANIFAYSNTARGIFVRNTILLGLVNLQATRNGQHGIFVQGWTESHGSNWISKNNSQATTNTYDDIHFTDDASLSYGVTDNCVLVGVDCGYSVVLESQYGLTNRPRYGLYLDDNITGHVTLAFVRVGGNVTGDIRLPASTGNLKLLDLPAGSNSVRLRVGDFVLDAADVRPSADNVRALGESTKRFLNTFSSQLRPGSGAPIWTAGTGTPEGAVAAPVGSVYADEAGGPATTLYVKESGVGNTGWKAVGSRISVANQAADFGSIAAQSTGTITVTVTGAAVGDTVVATPRNAPEAGIVLGLPRVSAADTVELSAANVTGSAIDPVSNNFDIDVWKH